jgi:hypothetical protein
MPIDPSSTVAIAYGQTAMPRARASRRTQLNANDSAIHIEAYFPADDASEAVLRALTD